MHSYLDNLQAEFETKADSKIAAKQKAYMRGQFDYYGLKTNVRRTIQHPFLMKAYLPAKSDLEIIVKTLWEKPQREYHYFTQELVFLYKKQFDEKDIALFEYMIVQKSWWDTVDFIASSILGAYFKMYPEKRKAYVEKWLESNNIWLQRSALLFQLKYKNEVNTELLSGTINGLLYSKEFFINKAIGWILRQYSRTNPEWVVNFVNETPLAPLSRKEALRLLK